MKRAICLIALLICLSSPPLCAQTISSTRLTSPPVIDGLLDDEAWQLAQSYSNFVAYEPVNGQPAKERTTAYAAYDARNL